MDAPLASPRYRVEHHDPPLPPLVVGFSRSAVGARAEARRRAAHMRSRGDRGEILTVDQDTEEVIDRVAL